MPPIPHGGSLTTQSGVDTTVNINAGAGITGGMLVFSDAFVAPTNRSPFNHNDPAGITQHRHRKPY